MTRAFIPRLEIGISAPYAFLPPDIVDNDKLVAWMGAEVRPAWIERRTGIRERRWAGADVAVSDLAVAAARGLAERDALDLRTVRQLVLCTVSGDYPTPPTAPLVQHALGLEDCGAFDVAAACAGFVTGLHVAAMACAAHDATQLVVAADIRSKFLARDDFATACLFGDGAAAAVVRRGAGRLRFVASRLFADGSVADIISIPSGGSRRPVGRDTPERDMRIVMRSGADVFLKAAEGMSGAAAAFLTELGLAPRDVRYVVPHQANLHLIREVGRRLELAPEQLIETVQLYGNTAGSSVGIALGALLTREKLATGDKLLLVAAGGGGVAGCVLLEA